MLKVFKKVSVVVIILVSVYLIQSCQVIDEPTVQPIYRYGNFARTNNKYTDKDDWTKAVRNEFGDGWRVAAWNDLKAFYNSGGNLTELLDALNIKKLNTVWLTRNGQKYWSGSRCYLAERHDGNPPYTFLVHDQLGNYLLSLGSWYDLELPILIYKK